MKIAVIGAGIFGTTAAMKLVDAGYAVDIYEKNDDILSAASGINQYRLHRGYHYPRSFSTASHSCLVEPLFRTEYKDAVIETEGSYYAIPKEGSKVSAEEFMQFCDKCGLEYEVATLPFLNQDLFEAVFKVKESIIDPIKLRAIVKQQLHERSIPVFLNQEVDASLVDEYDVVVNATYANLNFILGTEPAVRREYQFEVCEKLVLQLPTGFKGLSVVVADGPFFCFDPYGDTGYHVMGNVVHAIHHSNTGFFPEIPENIKPLLNKGVINNPDVTNFGAFVESAALYVPELSQIEHVGSMYTVRTVLPNVDATDERPTHVYRVNEKVINIFSGKLGNSVQAAIDTVKLVNQIASEREGQAL